ncbi:MAG: tetratricopeptide repeat protein, partial [Blastocatellia bacterium]
SKPMLVTLPFTLLLLDYWPLGRLRKSVTVEEEPAPVTPERRKLNKHKDDQPQLPEHKYAAASLPTLVLEKVPLLVMAGISSAVTIVAQGKGGAVGSTVTFSTWGRVSNAIVSYAMYLQKMIWPSGLAVFYPYTQGSLPPGRIVLSALLLVAITALAFVARSRFRFVTIGWLWYLGTLVPVIGLIQVGLQSRADRYAYVPLIGIFVLIVWGISEAAKRAGAEKVLACAAIGAALAFSVVTWRQLAYWHDSVTLFQEAAAVTQGNYIAYTNLGQALAGEGKTEEAAKDFATAIQFNPDFDEAQHNIGMALVQQGKLDEAIDHFKKAIQINPRMTDAYNKLGATLAHQERYDEAAPYLYKAIELNPDYPAAYANLGALLERQGKLGEALDFDFKALRLIAEHPMTLRTGEGNMMAVQVDCRAGGLLAKKGSLSDAMQYYKEALRLKPNYPPAEEGLNAIMDIFDRRSNPDAGQQQ